VKAMEETALLAFYTPPLTPVRLPEDGVEVTGCQIVLCNPDGMTDQTLNQIFEAIFERQADRDLNLSKAGFYDFAE
jgi:hypothetical protein